MLSANVDGILERLSDNDLVLDVGGWARPFTRADRVIDIMPFQTRGMLGRDGEGDERFGPEDWFERDLCTRERWPFADGEFAFVVCSHTLEDLRDPVWVCSEISRVGRAGYVEVPSRLEEQSWGVEGPWVGWAHHVWLIDVGDDALELVAKPHNLAAAERLHFPDGFHATLSPEERVQALWWEGSLPCRERVLVDARRRDEHVARVVTERLPGRGIPEPGRRERLLGRLGL